MGNQKSEDHIWNKNQIKSNDRDEIKNKINLQKIKKNDENQNNKDHIV
jgi:hypothetical protein